jgi:WD40 repeat protein
MPTNTLISDFKKNNVSASWADGHPKQWGTEEAKYEYPLPPNAYQFGVGLSTDEKLLGMVNGTHAKVISIESNATVWTGKVPFAGDLEAVAILTSVGGGYDLLVSGYNSSAKTDAVLRNKLSSNGTLASEQWTQYQGQWSNIDDQPFSKMSRQFLATTMYYGQTDNPLYSYDLDSPGSNVTFTGHTDWIMSAAFSPDGSYISTAAWDGTGKLWNAKTGELLHTWGPFVGYYGPDNTTYTLQNWLTNFSPDGKYVLLSIGAGGPTRVNVYALAALNSPVGSSIDEPVLSLRNWSAWVRSAAWSPDSSTLALGSSGLILVYSFKENKFVQRWEVEDHSDEVRGLTFFDEGKVLGYRIGAGLEAYGLDTNLKYRWGPGDLDRYGGGGEGLLRLRNKEWLGGIDADMKVRFWKAPV